MPIFDTLDAAGWHPITAATAADARRFWSVSGRTATGAIYYVLRAVNAGTGTVTVKKRGPRLDEQSECDR